MTVLLHRTALAGVEMAVKLLLAATLAGQDPGLAGLLEDLGAELKETAQ